jgi:hypothetical protein
MTTAKKIEKTTGTTNKDSFVVPPDPEKVVEIDIVGCDEGMLQNQLRPETKHKLQYGETAGASETKAQKTEKAKANWGGSGHFADNGSRGHPSESFLKAMQQSVPMVTLSGGKKVSSKVMVLRCISVLPDAFSKEGLPLCSFSADTKANSSVKVEPAEHWANNKNSGGTPVPVYRTHIIGGWKMTVRVSYDSTVMSTQDVLMLMQKAGSNVGVGSWRKEKGGVFGRWKVVGARASR